MAQNRFYLQQDATIEGRKLTRGTVIATIETPDGVDVNRALAAIRSARATPNVPEEQSAVGSRQSAVEGGGEGEGA